MSVTSYIDENAERNIPSYIANASFAASGTAYIDTTAATTYNFEGILVITNCVVADVSGFDSKHTGWANGDTLYASVGYYPLSGTSITLTSGTCLLIKA